MSTYVTRTATTTESAIRAMYEAYGSDIAERWPLLDKPWAANSRFGYVFDWFTTKEEAERHSIGYYLKHPHLV